MKNRIFTLVILFAATSLSFGQLTGTKTIPGNYASVAAAIAALNAQGVGAGGVTFNINPGYFEQFQSATAGLITATGTAANPIVFRKNGTAGSNPFIMGFSGASTSYDYIFALQGADYITFDGLDISGYGDRQEWGFAVLKASGTNGSQYVTIRNCNISMDKSNANSVGIYSANITPLSPGVQVTVTSVDGTNSNNRFYNNLVENAYNGMMVMGYDDQSPYSYYDRSNEIGSDGGNTLQNFGGQGNDCYGIFTKFQHLLNVKNNLITGSVDGSGEFSAIQVSTAYNASLNISYNTITVEYNGTGGFRGIFNNQGSENSGNEVNVDHNTVTGCTYPTGSNKLCYYISTAGWGQVTNVFNNTVSNNTFGDPGNQATGEVKYLQVAGLSPAVPPVTNIHGNVISGNDRQSVILTSNTQTWYINAGQGGGTLNLYNNTVTNNTVSANGYTYCINVLSQARVKKVFDNTVTNNITANGPIYGIYTGNGGECSIYRNRVQTLKSNGANAYVHGISAFSLETGAYGNCYVYNNLVGELNTPHVNNSSEPAITGIYLGGPGIGYHGCFNNAVYLDAVTSGSQFFTAGIYLGPFCKAFDLRNNIVINNSMPMGAGRSTAIGGDPNVFQLIMKTSNDNNYYAGVPSASHVIYFDGASFAQTLIDYKEGMWPTESRSITELTPFINTIVSPYDLHVNPGMPTATESSSSVITDPVTIATDFEGQPRFPNTGYPVNLSYPAMAPDMGADEFGGIPDDKTPPAIEFEPLLNTSEAGNRTLIATVTDAQGVPTSGDGLPRICWKRYYNGNWNYVTGQSLGNNQYKFEFAGGLMIGDTVHYFIIAQDTWQYPNAGTYPMSGSGGFTVNPPACSTPPNQWLSYVIVNPVCGTVNVGFGQTYPTLTAAINDLKEKHMTCPVTLQLTDNIYNSETYPIIIPNIPGASQANTLTIRPAIGVSPIFQGSISSISLPRMALISFVGAKHVILDGSNSGGTDRSLIVQNLDATGWAATVGFYSTDHTPASDIVVRNCVIRAHQDTVLNAQGISCYPMAGQPGFRNVEIRNNEISTAKVGIALGGERANRLQNIRIIGNTIGSMTPGNYITNVGMTFSDIDTLLLEANEVIGLVSGTNPTLSLIAVALHSGLSNVRVHRNIIHDWYHVGSGVAGLYFDTKDNPTVTEVTNNLIYNMKGPGVNTSIMGANPCGLWIWSGQNYKIQHNTIHMTGSTLASAFQTISYCIGFGGNGTSIIPSGIDLRNNILMNSMTNTMGGTGNTTYAVVTNTPTCFSNIDNNDYFLNGTGPTVGFLNGNRTTLSDWQVASGQDQHSMTVNPQFVSSSNYRPTNTLLNNKGVYLSNVSRDFDLFLRTNPPDPGIYEFGADPIVVTSTASDITMSGANLNGVVQPNNGFITPWFDYGTTSAYGSSVAASPSLVTGVSPVNISAAISSLAPGTTYHVRARGVGGDGLIIYGEEITFTTPAGLPVNTLVTGTVGSSTDTCYNASNTITVAGGANTFEIQNGGSVTMVAGQKISFLPGTRVYTGGYLHGNISTGTYCNYLDNPVTNAATSEGSSSEVSAQREGYILYPNPTTGDFTLVRTGELPEEDMVVEVYNIQGRKVLTEKLTGFNSYLFSLGGMPSGLYFVRIISGENLQTLKVVRM